MYFSSYLNDVVHHFNSNGFYDSFIRLSFNKSLSTLSNIPKLTRKSQWLVRFDTEGKPGADFYAGNRTLVRSIGGYHIKLNPDTKLVTVERRTRKRSLGIDKIVSPGVIRFTTSNKSLPPRPCGRSPGFLVDLALRSFHVIAGRCSVTRKRRYVNRLGARTFYLEHVPGNPSFDRPPAVRAARVN